MITLFTNTLPSNFFFLLVFTEDPKTELDDLLITVVIELSGFRSPSFLPIQPYISVY